MHPRLTYLMAGFWLPVLARTVAKVTGVVDYNIVQNNGKSTCKLLLFDQDHSRFPLVARFIYCIIGDTPSTLSA